MRYRIAVVAALAVASFAMAASAAMSPVVSAKLTPGAEKPAGPSGASGQVELTLNATKDTVCWTFSKIKGVTSPTVSHIHKGGKGVEGPVYIPLGGKFSLKGCAKAPKSSPVSAVEKNPAGFYVNIHNAKYPLGAIRGQLVAGMLH